MSPDDDLHLGTRENPRVEQGVRHGEDRGGIGLGEPLGSPLQSLQVALDQKRKLQVCPQELLGPLLIERSE